LVLRIFWKKLRFHWNTGEATAIELQSRSRIVFFPQAASIGRLNCVFLAITVFALSGCRPNNSVPGVVQGASMAPTLFGEHLKLNCRDCQYPIRFHLDAVEPRWIPIVCPNCGFAENWVEDSSVEAAQSVTIRQQHKINRWDVVAFQLPDSKAMGIKRVVGLPGEKIEIDAGDLVADGKWLVKPWEVLKQIRVPVYDSAYQPTLTRIGERWRPLSAKSAWRRNGSTWSFASSNNVGTSEIENETSSDKRWDWLAYQNWRCCAHTGNRDDVFPIEDIDQFNPALSRQLNPVRDLFFEMEVRVSEGAKVAWRCFHAWETIELSLDPDRCKLIIERFQSETHDSKASKRRTELDLGWLGEGLAENSSLKIELSTFDGQLKLVLNDRLVVDESLEDASGEIGSRVLEIGACDGIVVLSRAKIWRDVYYHSLTESQFSVPISHYLLFGDNVPISVDSRNWKPGGVPANKILGTVEISALE
jgi:signal peptidase I